jgi:hypothetical protein
MLKRLPRMVHFALEVYGELNATETSSKEKLTKEIERACPMYSRHQHAHALAQTPTTGYGLCLNSNHDGTGRAEQILYTWYPRARVVPLLPWSLVLRTTKRASGTRGREVEGTREKEEEESDVMRCDQICLSLGLCHLVHCVGCLCGTSDRVASVALTPLHPIKNPHRYQLQELQSPGWHFGGIELISCIFQVKDETTTP